MTNPMMARAMSLSVAGLVFGGLVVVLATMPVRFAPPVEGPEIIRDMVLIKPETPPSPPIAPPKAPQQPQRATPDLASMPTPPVPEVIPVEINPVPQPPAPPAEIAPPAPPAPPVIVQARPVGAAPRPNYPPRAVAREKEGAVALQLVVGPDGGVTDVVVLSEDPPGFGFAAAAITAVKATRFEPKRVDGRTVEGTFAYTIRFRLE